MKFAFLLFVFIPAVVFAQVDIGRFSVESVRAVECDQGMGNRYSSAMFERIQAKAPSALKIVQDSAAGDAKYRIRGTLTFHAENNADTKAVSKYVNELGGKYYVSVNVDDEHSVGAASRYTDTFTDPRDLEISAVRVSDRIIEYYRTVQEAVLSRKKAAEQAAAPERSAVSMRSFKVGVMGSEGVGRYQKFNTYGGGVFLAPEINLFGIVVKPSAGVQKQKPSNGNISRADTVRGVLSFGYDLVHAGPVTITPFAGYGLFYQNVRGTDEGIAKTCRYYNSIVNLELSVDCGISDHIGVFCSPSFSVFFESSRRDLFADIAFGLMFIF